MGYQDSVFNQILKVIPGYQLDRLIDKYMGDFRVRTLGCREQFLAMLFGQLTGRNSLRDVVDNFNANHQHFYHLGCRGEIRKSTLADANKRRPVEIYQDLFEELAAKALTGKKRSETTQLVSLIDATTIVLNQTRFGWAKGHSGKSGIKIHTVYDLDARIPTYFEVTTARSSDLSSAKTMTYEAGRTYVYDRGYYDFQLWANIDASGSWFVTRLKKNSPTKVISKCEIPAGESHILSDNEVMLNQRLARSRQNPYHKTLREVTVQVEAKKDPIRLITNDMESSAKDIAGLYKKRWQIELFFKWIKQNLKIKAFLGTSENALKIQVLVAMIAYLLLRLLNKNPFCQNTSILKMTRLVATNLMRRISLLELFGPPPDKPSKGKIKPQRSLSFA